MGAGSASAGVTCAANGAFQRGKRVFQPRLSDLFKPVAVISAAAHSIKVLRNNGMVGGRQRKPVQWLVTVVARSRSNSQPDEACSTSVLRHFRQLTNDHIRSGHEHG